jgi:site-specific DNA-methyltransferase (adenine-specific)
MAKLDPILRRERDLQSIRSCFEADAVLSAPNAVVIEGDSLQFLRRMPSHSVSLILTDPPYHATKKAKIYGDTSFEKDEHYLEWMAQYASEWRRVLRPNGSLFCFCDSSLSARLDVLLSKNFNMLERVMHLSDELPIQGEWQGSLTQVM